MISVREVIQSVLYNKGETYARQHSDEELINALNLVLNYLNLALINAESEYITKEKDIVLKNGKATLPSDFAKFKAVESNDYDGEFKISGNTIKLESNETISYYCILDKVETINDEIDLPYVLFALIVRYTGGVLDGTLSTDALAQALAGEVKSMTERSTSGPIVRPMQFYV